MNYLTKAAEIYQLGQRLIFSLGYLVGCIKKNDCPEKTDGAMYSISMNFSARIVKGKNKIGF
ncbi:MAG: hypothetical protein M0R41_02555 [Methylobacter tundripaludum]|nr:hypothetical protein [Methylobacter tundripaludum]